MKCLAICLNQIIFKSNTDLLFNYVSNLISRLKEARDKCLSLKEIKYYFW